MGTPCSDRSTSKRVPLIGIPTPADFIRARGQSTAQQTPHTWPRPTRCLEPNQRPLPRGSRPYMVRETMANDARWTLVFGKARLREDGTRHTDIAIPLFGYKSHAGIDRRHGFIRTWEVTDASSHHGRVARAGGCLTPRMPPRRSGPTAPTARKRTRPFSRSAASAARSIIASRGGARWRHISGAATLAAPKSAPPSSMSSPGRKAQWASSSGPSASSGPG